MNIISNTNFSTYWNIIEGNVYRVVDSNNNVIFEDITDYTQKWFTIRKWSSTDKIKVVFDATDFDSSSNITLNYKFNTSLCYPPFDGSFTLIGGNKQYIDLSNYEAICFRGQNNALATSLNNFIRIYCVEANNISTQAPFSVCGCLRSLTDVDPGTSTFGNGIYCKLFTGSKIKSAKNLILVNNLSTNMYREMFYGCSQLKHAPEELNTNSSTGTLASSCYQQMFQGCGSLIVAPIINGSICSNSSCYRMFYNCTNLNFLESHLTNISASAALYNWLYGVSSTGTLKRISTTTYPSGASGLPSGWQYQNI